MGDVWTGMYDAFRNGLRAFVCGALFAGLASAHALAQGTPQDAESELVVSVNVSVDPVKSNGSPWDGLPAVGGRIVAPAASNAPDIAFCVVLPTGPPECYWRTERGRNVSVCEDTRECTIDQVRFLRFPLGLIFLDVDLLRHDLIDFAILTDGTPATDDLAKLEANLRAVMARLTPGNTEAERQTRLRKARVVPLDLCRSASQKCDLTQSRFWVERK